MNCTFFGLLTGIIGLGAYAWLNGKTQGILDGINQGSVEALNLATTGRSPSDQLVGGNVHRYLELELNHVRLNWTGVKAARSRSTPS